MWAYSHSEMDVIRSRRIHQRIRSAVKVTMHAEAEPAMQSVSRSAVGAYRYASVYGVQRWSTIAYIIHHGQQQQ